MSNAKQTRRVTPGSRETLLHMLETLPDAFFVVDGTETIVYANASAQAMLGATREDVFGKSFWRCAPHLVSPSLYQAVQKAKQTREPTKVAYVSPATNSWLHVSLSPTDEGLSIFFQEQLEPPHLQHALSRNEQRYRDLLESVADGVTIVTPEGLVLDINQRPLADAHLRREEVIGKPLTDLPAWSSDPAVQQHLRAAIARASRGETVRFEARIHPRTDLYVDVSMTITSHRDASQQVEYLICAGRDITERKHAEDELRMLVDAIPHFVWIAGPDGSITYINQRLIAYLAMTLEQVEGVGWLAGVHPDDQQRVWNVWQTAIQTGVPYEVEHRLQDGTSGAYRWFLVRGVPQRNAQGAILHWVGTCTDIDEQKRAEQQLKASEENLRVLAETVPQLVWTTRPDGSVEYLNQRWYDSIGSSPEQSLGDGWRQFLHPDDYERTLAHQRHALATGEPFEIEYRFKDGKTGIYRWFLGRGMPVRDETGQITKWFGTCTDIEDQKRAEQQLKESQENWRVLAETVPQLVWTTQPDGRLDYCNQRYCEYTQADFEQLHGYGWRQFLHPEDAERVVALRHQTLETGELFESEHRLKDGQTGLYRWFLARAMPVRDEAGQIVKWFGTCTDIHDKKQAEEELRVLIDAIPQFVWILRPDGSSDYGNQRWCDYTTMTFQQYQGDGWLQAIHPDDYQHTLTLWRHACASGEPFEIEYRLKDGQTGTYRWFLARAMPVRNDTGQIVKWFGTCTDIEDQKRAEERIKASEENLRVLAETVPQLVWTARPDGALVYWNHRWYAYTGSSLEQSLGYAWSQFLHPDDYQHTLTVWHHALATGEPYEIAYRFKGGTTGDYRWFLARAMPVYDEAGQIVKWFGTCTDIEDQKRIEEALRQSQERVQALWNSTIIGIYLGQGEEVVEANDAFLRMTGYTQDDLRNGRIDWARMTPPEYAAVTRSAHEELALHQSMTPYEKEYICQDGSRLPVVVGGVTVPSNPFQCFYFVLDNSARKELEQRKDDFINMASHELRNPLTALKLQTTLLHRQLAKQGLQDSAPALSRMETQINKVTRLVEELLDVSKMQAGRLEYRQETVDLDALLQEITDTLQQTSSSHTILVRGAVQTSLIGDRDRLGQVFTNLISNAIKYSPDAQTVEIDLDASPETVTIHVHDHGLGIPREQRDKIFERFYRATGPKQKAIPGLGMGLYIVAEIVKRHGGTITVESTVGEGSTFTVTLPRNRDT